MIYKLFPAELEEAPPWKVARASLLLQLPLSLLAFALTDYYADTAIMAVCGLGSLVVAAALARRYRTALCAALPAAIPPLVFVLVGVLIRLTGAAGSSFPVFGFLGFFAYSLLFAACSFVGANLGWLLQAAARAVKKTVSR